MSFSNFTKIDLFKQGKLKPRKVDTLVSLLLFTITLLDFTFASCSLFLFASGSGLIILVNCKILQLTKSRLITTTLHRWVLLFGLYGPPYSTAFLVVLFHCDFLSSVTGLFGIATGAG